MSLGPGPPIADVFPSPPTYRGRFIHLEPLRTQHVRDLEKAASEAEIWRYMGSQAHTPDALARWIAGRIEDVQRGTALAFLVRDAATGAGVGSSSLFDYAAHDRRIEIGHTWIGRSHRGTSANTEMKLPMMRWAFEDLGCMRVQLRTDPLNERSRRAIRRLGAREEGILRHYVRYEDGTMHDRVFHSVLAHEWADVRGHLERKLAEPAKA